LLQEITLATSKGKIRGEKNNAQKEKDGHEKIKITTHPKVSSGALVKRNLGDRFLSDFGSAQK